MMRRSQNYVCWQCCLRPAERALLQRRTRPSATAAFSALATSSLTSPSSPSNLPVYRAIAHQSTRSASTASSPAPDSKWDWSPHPKQLRAASQESLIRERLRTWEAENPAPARATPSDDPSDGVANSAPKTWSDLNTKLEDSKQDDDAMQPHFDGDDMVDLGSNGSVMQTGDLIEVSSGSFRVRLLAVCLGNFNGQLHFYTNTGKWFTSRNPRSGFVVKNFVQDPAELQAIIDAIPSLSPSTNVLNELQDLNIGPSRDLAASLIRKMYAFQSASRLVHQTYVERLSRAHSELGKEERLLSLREIADVLLPASLKRNKATFPPEALYAVYTVIEEDDIAFRALDRGARHHESYLFFHYSAVTKGNVYRVEQLVREYFESLGARSGKSTRSNSLSPTAMFKSFLSEARKVIDQARKEREWSPSGMIGPSKNGSSTSSAIKIPAWSAIGYAVIKFMEHWASSGAFRSGSRCHWIGASVLRAIGRYDDVLLDTTTAWTFLQEIGWIPPWDVSARHYLRLPGLPLNPHAGLVPAPTPDTAAAELVPDQLAHIREDFARSTVYCIDSADTLDVDDGISLETAGNGEYWVHVHVADPASRIRPGSPLGKQAALRTQTNYLAGFYQRMFDHDSVREAFSLGPNQPTLTFSARLTEEGRMVEHKVTPGILRDVVCMTPEEVSSICGDVASAAPSDFLEVGTPPAKRPPVRNMATSAGLSRQQLNDIKTLSKLAKALQGVRLEKGAIPAYLPRPKAQVSLDNVTTAAALDGSVYYSGDPHICVSYGDSSGNPLVSSLMQLAGEVGARWCHERDIPIPYRVQLSAGQNMDALREFTRDVFYPQLLAGKNPSPEDNDKLRALAGGFDVSTTPGSNFAMGLDLYTKVTSPLRRYPDLLVHWQIEAALLEEHRRGQSLTAKVAENKEEAKSVKPAKQKKTDPNDFLPYSKSQLDNSVLPRLRVRERHAKILDNVDGNSQWMLQALVRAWRFGEGAQALPETFRFRVLDVQGKQTIKGRIDWFDRPAMVELEDVNDVILMANVKPADVFRVELARVNVHTNKIYVRLLEKIE